MATISKAQRDEYINIVAALGEVKRDGESFEQATRRLVAMATTPAAGLQEARVVSTPPGGVAPIGDLGGVQPSGSANGDLCEPAYGEPSNPPTGGYVDVVLARGPDHDSDFVELEDASGKSISFGRWITPADDDARADGHWRLRLPIAHDAARHLKDVQSLQAQIAKDGEVLAAIDAAYNAGPWLLGPRHSTPLERAQRIKVWLADQTAVLVPLHPFATAADEGADMGGFLAHIAAEMHAWREAAPAVAVLMHHRQEGEALLDAAKRVCAPSSGRVAKDALAALQGLREVERSLGRFRTPDDGSEAIGQLAARLAGEVDSWRSIEALLVSAQVEDESLRATVQRLVAVDDDRLEREIMAHEAGDPEQPQVIDLMAELKKSVAPGASATHGACPGCGSVRADEFPADAPIPLTPPWSVRVDNYRMIVDMLNDRDGLERQLEATTEIGKELEAKLRVERDRSKQAEAALMDRMALTPPPDRSGAFLDAMTPRAPIRVEVVHRWEGPAAPPAKDGG